MKSKSVIASVPDARKATAVKASLQGPVSPAVPASILQGHSDCTVYVDDASGSML
jgi:glucosamine-6-phosphate deaminase